MECEPFESAVRMEGFRRPAVLFCREQNVSENGADIYCLAMVAVVVFSEFLHGRSFRERGGVANIFIESSPLHRERAILDAR